jgi:hypothetical protein
VLSSAYIKDLNSIKKALDPASDLHLKKDLSLLKPHVSRLRDCVEEHAQLARLGFDIGVAWKAIVQERKERAPSAAERPSLNTSDLGLE